MGIHKFIRPYLVKASSHFHYYTRYIKWLPFPNYTVLIFGLGILTIIFWSLGVEWFKWIPTILLILTFLFWFYFDAYPLEWDEMDDFLKVVYVSYNGFFKLTEDQIQEYQQIIESDNKYVKAYLGLNKKGE